MWWSGRRGIRKQSKKCVRKLEGKDEDSAVKHKSHFGMAASLEINFPRGIKTRALSSSQIECKSQFTYDYTHQLN